MKNWLKAVIALLLPQVVGVTAALLTETGESSWYQNIQRPQWNPPGWVFGPVWTLLYLAMGWAFYLVWKSPVPPGKKRPALVLWVVQLVFNFFWTLIFFGAHEIGWALVEIAALWLLILLTIFAFARVRKGAAWLLVPYISWVSFATLLTYTIWRMNGG